MIARLWASVTRHWWSPLARLWASVTRHWWSPLMALGVVLFLAYAGWSAVTIVHNQNEQNEIAEERRVSGRGLLYGGCLEDNRQNLRDDRSYQNLAVLSLTNPENDPERISRALDALREGLNLANCEAVLDGLPPDQAARARQQAEEVPRLPLPPPTVPGYIPPSNAD